MNDVKGTAAPAANPATAASSEEISLPGCILNHGDYTYYVTRKPLKSPAPPNPGAPAVRDGNVDLNAHFDAYKKYLNDKSFGENAYSAAFSGKIVDTADPPTASIEGRLLACGCYAGAEIAVTIRGLSKVGAKTKRDPVKDGWNDADNGYRDRFDPTEVPFPMPLDEICDRFAPLGVFDENVTGLVLITGATNSAKSELTRALIHRFLDVRRGKSRWPHLVTFEDPIEKRLFPTSADALARGIEYTPRQKGVDVGTLKDALEDALRQTPAVFYVGEVRAAEDWKELLSFAGTGHLVVATAHSASLVEAMERIFRGVGAKTATERGQIAQRILAVIHQRTVQPSRDATFAGLPKDFGILLPAIWRRTPAGIAALISDGLASVLPHTPREGEDINRVSSFGRRWFAKSNPGATIALWAAIIRANSLAQALETHWNSLAPPPKEVGRWGSIKSSDAAKQLGYAAVRRKQIPDIVGTVLQSLLEAKDAKDVADLRAWFEKSIPTDLEKAINSSTSPNKQQLISAGAAQELAARTFAFLETEAIRFDLQGA